MSLSDDERCDKRDRARSRVGEHVRYLRQPAQLSVWFQPIEAAAPRSKLVAVSRVSHENQRRNGNLDDQERELLAELARRGHEVVCSYAYVGSGKYPDLGPAVSAARQTGAVGLAFITPDRAIRPSSYDRKDNPNAKLQNWDVRAYLSTSLPVYVLHLDSTQAEHHARHTRRGQRQKGRKGGRPPKNRPGYKRDRRRVMLPFALRLHAEGKSLNQIVSETEARENKVPRSTASRWINLGRQSGRGAGRSDQR
jgi:hypothetical protein